MTAQVAVTSVAVLVSIGSFLFAWHTAHKAARAEDIKNLLGEKESVGFGAVKLLRGHLPGEQPPRLRLPGWKQRADRERELIVAAVIAACVFEGSGRARALLFRVVEKYRDNEFERSSVTRRRPSPAAAREAGGASRKRRENPLGEIGGTREPCSHAASTVPG